MSVSRRTTVFCDSICEDGTAPDWCYQHGWVGDNARAARAESRHQGWLIRPALDLCPPCRRTREGEAPSMKEHVLTDEEIAVARRRLNESYMEAIRGRREQQELPGPDPAPVEP